jgi:hypothetical protein
MLTNRLSNTDSLLVKDTAAFQSCMCSYGYISPDERVTNCVLLCFNTGICRGRCSSEHFDSVGIIMKSLEYGPRRFLFGCY